MNKIIKCTLDCMLVFMVSGCNVTATKSDNFEESGIFEEVSRKEVRDVDFITVYHKETKVMYLVCVGYSEYSSGIGITPLLNPDGTPMLYEEKVGK